MLLCRHAIVTSALLMGIALNAQVPARIQAIQQIAEPPVPSDPLELVTGDAQPVTDVNQRAEIIKLLTSVQRNSDVRTVPYDLKTTFTVSGPLSSGQWQEEDTFLGTGRYRWTAEGPGYSALNMTVDKVFYSSQPSAVLPLRLMQVRQAIFRVQPVIGPYATLRTANASLNGADLVCTLLAHMVGAAPTAGGRRWEEAEYCVDPKAGTLVMFSEVPGVYVHYDYTKALQFHGRQIPNGFTITEAGQTIVEAQTQSVADPANNPAAFQTAGLNQVGVGPVMSLAPARSRVRLPLANGAPGAMAHVVTLHAMASPGGQLSDAELLASSDPSLNQSALAFASQWQGGTLPEQEGATPQSHELVLILQYGGGSEATASAQ